MGYFPLLYNRFIHFSDSVFLTKRSKCRIIGSCGQWHQKDLAGQRMAPSLGSFSLLSDARRLEDGVFVALTIPS